MRKISRYKSSVSRTQRRSADRDLPRSCTAFFWRNDMKKPLIQKLGLLGPVS